jgi:hypothetical protein
MAQTHYQAACASAHCLVLACVAVHLGQMHLAACSDQPAKQEKIITMRIASQLADWHKPQQPRYTYRPERFTVQVLTGHDKGH